MSDRTVNSMSATQCMRELRAGRIKAIELLESSLRQLHACNDRINAVTFIADEGALRAAAQDADRRDANGSAAPLAGLPVTVKDNLWVREMPATWGSVGLREHRPDADEPAVARVRAAGGLVVGKTNVPEFALAATTANAVYGVTRNPLDLHLTPGGSSGGAAASVAAGIVPLALATDAGGSIRRPAAYTGIVGFKPSQGVVEPSVGFPRTARDFQVIGPLARTVADCALLTAVIARDDSRLDLSPLLTDAEDALRSWAQAQRARILLVKPDVVPHDAQVLAVVDEASKVLARAGHEVIEAPMPFDIAAIERIWGTLIAVGTRSVVATLGLRRDELTRPMQQLVERGDAIGERELNDVVDLLLALRAGADSFWRDFDLVLSPTSPCLPWSHELPYPSVIAGREAGPRAGAYYATFANALECPAVSLPTSVQAGALGIGVQLAAAPRRDRQLLAWAYELEQHWGQGV